MTMLAEYWQTFLTMLFPDRCICCDEVVEPGVLCCKYCLQELPLATGQNIPVLASDPYRWVTAPFYYRDGVRRAIGQMKFRNRPQAAEFFVPYMLEAVLAAAGPDYRPDGVVPVPMEESRRKERGYNQAELLAQGLAQALRVPCRTDLLMRCTDIAQHDLSAGLRAVNAQRSFQAAPGADPSGLRLLLVDDIFTTGNSIRRCAQLLKEGGAAEVACAVAAFTPHRDRE